MGGVPRWLAEWSDSRAMSVQQSWRRLAVRGLRDGGAKGAGELLSDATQSGYEREWARWEKWAIAHSYPPLPADVAHLAEYATGLLVLGASAGGVGMVLSSIRWRHRTVDAAPLPMDDRIPATLRSSAERETLTAADAAELVAATSQRRVYRVGRGVRLERQSRTRKRAMTDSVIIGLGWETLATAAEIAGLEWTNVDLVGSMVRYKDCEGWSPVSEGLAHRLGVLAEIDGATGQVVGLSPASVRRRVKEAANYGGLGSGWSLRGLRTGAVRALTARGASLADLTRAGLSASAPPHKAWLGAARSGWALAAHVEDSPIPIE